MVTGQHAENLAWIREQWPDLRCADDHLQKLLTRALNGEGELLRVSPQRTVLRIADKEGGNWLCKLAHPRRRGEGLRRRLSEGPVIRERDACLRLQDRLGFALQAWAEQVRPGFGLFVRPYWTGIAPQADAATAEALAALHQLKWLDRDLALDDLLWVDHEGDRVLLPLDLGHAQVAAFPVPQERIYAALIRVLSTLQPADAERWAPQLLAAHQDLLPDWELPVLLERVKQLRRKRAWKRSRRAFRTCSDFETAGRGARRRTFKGNPPVSGSGDLLATGPRSTSRKEGDVVWKFYPRSGLLQALRRRRRRGPGAMAYRALAALEIVGLAAVPALAWIPTRDGEWLATPWRGEGATQTEDLPALATWLARLHAHGLGCRDAKCSNFVMTADGPLLVDADGITKNDRDRARDLGRLLAEEADDGEVTARALEAYEAEAGELSDVFRRRLRERCEFFRAKLRAANQ